ncbi:MAG: hypothetical protein F7B78_05365 [Desulfurococcales archaeon]|nr:hypothetical protein [Desulfurococcales archaeon]
MLTTWIARAPIANPRIGFTTPYESIAGNKRLVKLATIITPELKPKPRSITIENLLVPRDPLTITAPKPPRVVNTIAILDIIKASLTGSPPLADTMASTNADAKLIPETPHGVTGINRIKH